MHRYARILLWTEVAIISFSLLVSKALATADQSFEISYATDVKGVRHSAKGYPRFHEPWRRDLLAGFGPKYPYTDRVFRHQGTGVYKLLLDLKTGAVASVAILHSSGFKSLDDSAVGALGKWRWKPGRWKEIQMPVKFQLAKEFPPLPPGATRLQHLR
jgi:TonB family protein